MNLIETSDTIDLWVNSCRTHEQLDLLGKRLRNFINPQIFKDENKAVVDSAIENLRESIQFKKDILSLEKPISDSTQKDYL